MLGHLRTKKKDKQVFEKQFPFAGNSSTSFPGFSLFLPRDRENPGNEVGNSSLLPADVIVFALFHTHGPRGGNSYIEMSCDHD